MTIASPEDGATVQSPFTVGMEAEGLTIEPAGEARDGAGHFHLMVDTDCVAPGQVIPEDEGHLHYGDGATEAELNLSAGEHSLCLQAGDGAHTALGLTDEVTITVVGQGGAPPGTETEAAGEVWEGTYAGTFFAKGPGNCRNEFEGTFEIRVDPDGTATMEGTGTSQTFCAGQVSEPFTSDFVAVGERTSSGFSFEDATPYGPGQIPLLTIEVTGNEGTTQYEGPSGVGAGTATIDFEVECRSC